jgi:hypothetical protein
LKSRNQFITVLKKTKIPYNTQSHSVCDPHDPSVWLSYDEARRRVGQWGALGIGFVFTKQDPYFFIDIDSCLNPDGRTWSDLAVQVCAMFPGAAVEVSQSGRGLHIFGSGAAPDHSCKNTALGMEFYTDGRYVLLSEGGMRGDPDKDFSAVLAPFVDTYFQPRVTELDSEWREEPVVGWAGHKSDDKLIEAASNVTSAASAFGGGARATFADLFTGNQEVLSKAYPDKEGVREYDASSADAALAQHLAFWTGKHHERILRIMKRSGLSREKWEREDYLVRTITRACLMQEDVHGSGSAKGIKSVKLSEATAEEREVIAKKKAGKFWIENADRSTSELVSMLTPKPDQGDAFEPRIISGFQYLGAGSQMEHFKGCVYIQDLHRVLIPGGFLLRADQFNATYGGYVFQLDETGDKTTRKAWEAFTESQLVRWPKASSTCFKPNEPEGKLFNHEGRILANCYSPIVTPRMKGDAGPFLRHLEKLLPVQRDRDIILAYMAACIQHKGVKFQWAPLLQGAEGNGKTLLTRCVAYAVGKRYTHYPKAADIDNKFNGWLLNKLFIGVEDIYVPSHRREVIETLKPMITGGDGLEIQLKGVDQITADICANFMLNSNHKDAIRKSRTDRRFCVFYTAQQTDADLVRDGMSGSYFPDLYEWLNSGGYAIVSEYLHTYEIAEELNPAGACHRAPETSSTDEAIMASVGTVEQEILEAIEEERTGFRGGWVSSVAVEKLLQSTRIARLVPQNKRRELLQSIGYDYPPALNNGRVNSPLIIDDGKKPRLFIKKGHLAANLENPSQVSREYQMAQGVPDPDESTVSGAAGFSNFEF